MIFRTHAYNIPQIRAIIREHGQCWFHGDGNCYDNEMDSRNHRDFVNPKQEEAKYRICFKSESMLPTFVNGETKEETEKLNDKSVESLNEMLMKSKNAEIREERKETATKGVKTVSLTDDMQPKGRTAPQPEPLEDDGPTAEDLLKTAEDQEKRQKALDDRSAKLDRQIKELQDRQAELDKKAAELDKKAAKVKTPAAAEPPQE